MRFSAALILSLSLFLLPSPAFAGPVEDGIAAFNSRDYDGALKILRPLAEQGDPAAQYQLGYMYLYGQGLPKNYAEAWFWLTIASNASPPDPKGAVTAAAGRNQILKNLTPEQIEAVKKRVEEWKPVEPPAPAESVAP
jgi:TPR repeat protein